MRCATSTADASTAKRTALGRNRFQVPHYFRCNFLVVVAYLPRNAKQIDEGPNKKAPHCKPIQELNAPFPQLGVVPTKEKPKGIGGARAFALSPVFFQKFFLLLSAHGCQLVAYHGR